VLKKIIDAIRKPKATAAELREALAGINEKAAEAVVDQLEVERQKLLLQPNSDAELEAIEIKIRAGQRDAERQYAAKRELERLLAEAEQREAREAIEATAAGARDASTQLIGLYCKADELAAELAEVLREIVKQRSIIKMAGTATAEAGRPDLRVREPLGALAQHLGLPTSDHLVDPVGWQLRGYWPSIDPQGFPTKLDRSLGRARELQAAPARKAA